MNRTHAALNHLDSRDGQLVIGDRTVAQHVADAGTTPLYIYDRARIASRIAHLRTHLPAAVKLHYAVKANPHPSLLNFMAEHVDGFDIASSGELALARAAGANPATISFAGPGKSRAELKAALQHYVTVNAESEREVLALTELGVHLGVTPRLMLRINPDFEIKSSGMRMGGGPQPFGVDAECAAAVLAKMRNLPLHFRGLHIYAGSQCLRHETLCESLAKTFDLAYRLTEQAGTAIETLNIGGGFGIPYFAGEHPLDIIPVAQRLQDKMEEARARLGAIEVILELGRYLVGEAGYYVCEIIDKKISRGKTFLVTNGGLHHHLAACGRFGQVIRRNYPVVIGNKIHAPDAAAVTVVGPLCTPLDILADEVVLPHADIGDLVVILQSGAYGLSASPVNFLSHPAPAQVWV